MTPPEGCTDVIKSLMLSCWEFYPKNRTSFEKIVEILSEDSIHPQFAHSNVGYKKKRPADYDENETKADSIHIKTTLLSVSSNTSPKPHITTIESTDI